jgi:hypothetical protein
VNGKLTVERQFWRGVVDRRQGRSVKMTAQLADALRAVTVNREGIRGWMKSAQRLAGFEGTGGGGVAGAGRSELGRPRKTPEPRRLPGKMEREEGFELDRSNPT